MKKDQVVDSVAILEIVENGEKYLLSYLFHIYAGIINKTLLTENTVL